MCHIMRALSQMETCPFKWDCAHQPFLHTFLFVVWATGVNKNNLKYHLNIVSGKRLCMKARNLPPGLAPE